MVCAAEGAREGRAGRGGAGARRSARWRHRSRRTTLLHRPVSSPPAHRRCRQFGMPWARNGSEPLARRGHRHRGRGYPNAAQLRAAPTIRRGACKALDADTFTLVFACRVRVVGWDALPGAPRPPRFRALHNGPGLAPTATTGGLISPAAATSQRCGRAALGGRTGRRARDRCRDPVMMGSGGILGAHGLTHYAALLCCMRAHALVGPTPTTCGRCRRTPW